MSLRASVRASGCRVGAREEPMGKEIRGQLAAVKKAEILRRRLVDKSSWRTCATSTTFNPALRASAACAP